MSVKRTESCPSRPAATLLAATVCAISVMGCAAQQGGGQKGGPPIAQSIAPRWNAWVETYSGDDPSFNPLPKLLTGGHTYSLIVDLGALAYVAPGVLNRELSDPLYRMVQEVEVTKPLTLDVLLLHDERTIDLSSDQRLKKLPLDVRKIRAAWDNGLAVTAEPFEALREDPDAPFSFGRKAFHFSTRDTTGRTALGLSFWANGRPVDELSIPLCLVSSLDQECSAKMVESPSFSGIAPAGAGYPDAALHLIELQGTGMVGVFRCNSCAEATNGKYLTWRLTRSAEKFRDVVRTQIIPTMENAPRDDAEKRDAELQKAGDALYNAVFGHGDSGDIVLVRQAITSLSAGGQRTPSLFVRLLPRDSGLTFPLPLDLMWLPHDGGGDFLAASVIVENSLPYPVYGRDVPCIKRWEILVPPDGDMDDARRPLADWIWRFKRDPGSNTYGVSDFSDWVSQAERESESLALLTLSHHTKGRLCFSGTNCLGESVLSASIRRTLAIPSVAIVNACGTAKPGPSTLVRDLNEHGASTVIATSTAIEQSLAGAFSAKLLDLLAEHAADPGYTLAQGKFDATRELRTNFGAAAFSYSLLGNGSVRLCPPPEI